MNRFARFRGLIDIAVVIASAIIALAEPTSQTDTNSDSFLSGLAEPVREIPKDLPSHLRKQEA